MTTHAIILHSPSKNSFATPHPHHIPLATYPFLCSSTLLSPSIALPTLSCFSPPISLNQSGFSLTALPKCSCPGPQSAPMASPVMSFQSSPHSTSQQHVTQVMELFLKCFHPWLPGHHTNLLFLLPQQPTPSQSHLLLLSTFLTSQNPYQFTQPTDSRRVPDTQLALQLLFLPTTPFLQPRALLVYSRVFLAAKG